MPDPSSPPLPAVTRTDTTLGSTARATATQSGAGAPFVTRGAELPCDEVPFEDEPPEEPDVVCAAEDASRRFSAIPIVSRLDRSAAPAPTATTPVQPGPRRPARCCGTGGDGGGPHRPDGWGCVTGWAPG